MKKCLYLFLITLATASLMISCKPKDPMKTPAKVEIRQIDGRYEFFVNDSVFELKGAGGGGNLALLHESGGNAIRTWGPGQDVLDSAYKHNIMVALGISMGQQLHGFDYDDTAAVNTQYRRNVAAIEQFKDHPALLCWVVGNELNINPGRGVQLNPKVWDAVKDVVDYIHETDPNHPVTTAFAGVPREPIRVALERCPDLDFVSVQVYGSLGRMNQMIKAAGITKPFAITEYGPIGHWERPSTEWGREIEETSAQKATGLYDRIQNGIVNDSTGLCLGGFAFIWGRKQERTPTWYGMFLKTGESIAVVDELTRYWTGRYPANRAPKVDSLQINGRNAVDNIYVKPGSKCVAKLFMSEPENDPINLQWEMLKEVLVRSQGGAREEEPDTVQIEVVSDENGELIFTAPKETGEYRLFAYVYDGKGKAGTANVPFFVK